MNKRIIYVAIIIIIILGATIIGLIARHKSANQIPKVKNFQAEKINNLKVLDPALTPDGTSMVYYDIDKLDLYELNLASNKTTKLSEDMDQPSKIIWSPDKTQAIIKILYDKYKFEKFASPFANPSLQDQTSTLWNYNIKTKKYTLLDTNIFNPAPLNPLNPVWTADSQYILYHYLDQSNNISVLNIADPDGTNWRKVGNVPAEMYSILNYEDSNNTVFYSTYSTDTNLYDIYKFSITNQKKEDIVKAVEMVNPLGENQIIYTKINQTAILDFSSNQERKLPITVEEGKVGLSDDNKKILAVSKENEIEHLYPIQLDILEVIADINPELKDSYIENPLISADGNILYFTDQDYLYKIDMKKGE